jgi:DNA recombination protein RmuC
VDATTVVTLVLLAGILATLIWLAARMRRDAPVGTADQLEAAVALLKADLVSSQTESLLALRSSLDTANQMINDRLSEGTVSLDRRMAVLGEIQTQLGKLTIQTDNIEAVGKNIQSLSDLLRPPQLRGAVGELLLDNILSQILPRAAYEIQHRFANGLRVDAVIKVGKRLLPVDAKFPMEAFERLQTSSDDPDLQKQFSQSFHKHIDAIAEKYLQPEEGTTDFAVMYIPAEAVYYQLISQAHQEGFEYALAHRVIPSSPGHLYAFLASVATLYSEISLAGGELSESGARIRAGIDRLLETSERLARFHSRMEGSLRGLTAGFDRARSELDQIRLQLEKLREPFPPQTGDTETKDGPLEGASEA